uniref:Reverse transcriptase domain-containing protein n=1 Tax=Oryzias melastigma TaxID=30732 RepID=A0A3B3BMJ4_ORYME
MLFLDFSSAFNTVIPSQLMAKLIDLRIGSLMCNWLVDFLTSRPQHVRLDNLCSSTITINTGVPQGCVMSPFLYSLLTHDCKPVNSSNTIIKFADDTTVIGLIKDNEEAAYREEVERLADWCDINNLLLNTEKTKELIVDFRKNADPHAPIHIKGEVVERVDSFKFLGVHISEDLSWTTACSKVVKKAHQRLFFLRTLRRNHLSTNILVNFYRCTIESILTNCITVWYGSCSAADRKALQRAVKIAQHVTGAPLPAIKDIYKKRCLKRAGKIIKDSNHPAHGLFTPLPSGRRYRSLRTKTTRFQNSFFPTATTLLNSASTTPL